MHKPRDLTNAGKWQVSAGNEGDPGSHAPPPQSHHHPGLYRPRRHGRADVRPPRPPRRWGAPPPRGAGKPILAHDLRPEPLERLASNAVTAASVARIAAKADLILLSLPDGKAMASVVAALEPHLKPGQCVVDTSTSSVALTREIGARLTAKGILFADAPVARTREAAAKGELSIMVGATEETFRHIRPILQTMGTDVTHCGPVGCGQVVKILNNMLVFQHCAALAEAIAIGRRNGVAPEVLLPTMAMGSGDSFVLRNHGMKAMLPRQ